MSMLELRLKVQFSDSEVTSILNNAEEFKIPVIEYDPETLQDQVNEVIKIQDLGYVKEVILYADPVIAHPSMIQSLSVHHHKMRLALFFTQASATTDDLFKFGHGAYHLVKYD